MLYRAKTNTRKIFKQGLKPKPEKDSVTAKNSFKLNCKTSDWREVEISPVALAHRNKTFSFYVFFYVFMSA